MSEEDALALALAASEVSPDGADRRQMQKLLEEADEAYARAIAAAEARVAAG